MRGKSLIQCERVKRSEHKGSEACGEREPGMESPVQAGYQSLWQIRVAMGSRDAERNKVAKSVSHASRKAAIVYTVPVP